jgi:hypothetical protein
VLAQLRHARQLSPLLAGLLRAYVHHMWPIVTVYGCPYSQTACGENVPYRSARGRFSQAGGTRCRCREARPLTASLRIPGSSVRFVSSRLISVPSHEMHLTGCLRVLRSIERQRASLTDRLPLVTRTTERTTGTGLAGEDWDCPSGR